MKQVYGLVGYPLGHSFSKDFFNNKFLSEKLDAEYVNFELPDLTELTSIVKNQKDLSGLNVTTPYKEKIIPMLDEMDPCAKEIGAVNVVKFIRNKDKVRLKGFNSDWKAFALTLEGLLKPNHRKALILGTGGASKAVAYALKSLGIEYLFVSRSGKNGALTYEDLDVNLIEDYSIIINSTPQGMYPNINNYPPIPYEYLTDKNLLYDLLYNPEKTTFMAKGEARGAQTKNGLEMLLLQAIIGWQIWNE
ncbi:MAG: shikimate dehydrogenase [Bacteroidales bacterium]|jgi:shikimate dehydrogenase|nr:shikimate dehydrogenase [Bacteroidales bacterium]